MKWRNTVHAADIERVRELVARTGYFSTTEIDIAAELVAETVLQGDDSDYRFLFADAEDAAGIIRGYSCYGLVPATRSSFDLYWIAVDPDFQGKGLGREILVRTENLAAAQGATAMYVDTSGRQKYRPTRAFYAAQGYDEAARLEGFYAPGDDKVIFRKQLAKSASRGKSRAA